MSTESITDFRPGDSVFVLNPRGEKEHLKGFSGVVILSWPALCLLALDLFNDETGKLEVHYFYHDEVSSL